METLAKQSVLFPDAASYEHNRAVCSALHGTFGRQLQQSVLATQVVHPPGPAKYPGATAGALQGRSRTNIFPSPICPVSADDFIVSKASPAMDSSTTTSIFILGTKST